MIRGFDETAFLAANPDIRTAIKEGRLTSVEEHLLQRSLAEIEQSLRQFHVDFAFFEESKYLKTFFDVQEAVSIGAFVSGFDHFCKYGYQEIVLRHRSWPDRKEMLLDYLIKIGFDVSVCFENCPRMQELYAQNDYVSLEKFMADVGLEVLENGECHFHENFAPFDETLYVENFPNVETSIVGEKTKFKTPFEHFCMFGYKEIINHRRSWPEQKAGLSDGEENKPEIFWRDSSRTLNDEALFDDQMSLEENKADTVFEENTLKTAEKTISNELTDAQKHEYHILSKCGAIDWEEYKIAYETSEPIIHYIKSWAESLPVFPGFFDTGFYLETYEDVASCGINPLMQYVEFGQAEGREGLPPEAAETEDENGLAIQLTDAQQHEYVTISGFGLDWENYFLINHLSEEDLSDPVLHYVLHYRETQPIVDGTFDTAMYFQQYPDIEESGFNPLIHFIRHGKSEGRIGWVDVESHISKGAIASKPDTSTLIVVTHESSATGAPLVSLNFAKEFCEIFNVINVVLRKSKLHNDYLDTCEYLIDEIGNETVMQKVFKSFLPGREVLAVICNSVETFPVLKAANLMGLPTVSLVHEFADYTRPLGKMSQTIFYANRVIVPATILRDAIYRELKEVYAIRTHPNNIVVQPQGKLPMIPEGSGENKSIQALLKRLNVDENDKETRVVVGAGYVQMRKGVDLFISMAKQVKERYGGKCKFIWVGAGYDPVGDLAYSVWLRRQFEMIEGDKDFIFLEHQKNLDNVMAIADVFALTSRLDPFPNVVIDAMTENVYVACFEDSTGCAEFLVKHKADASITDYLDTSKMADGILKYFNKYKTARRTRVHPSTKNSTIVKEHLDFKKYTEYLQGVCMEAHEVNEANEKALEMLLETNAFDAEYYTGKPYDAATMEDECRSYVNMGSKSLHLYNPRPGFSEKQWLNEFGGGDAYQVALFEGLKSGQTRTHDVVEYDDVDTDETFSKKFAIHLHLYYTDLAEEFVGYFSTLKGEFDVLITMVKMDEAEEVRTIFEACGAANVYITEVENRGRDVSPFFDAVSEQVLSGDYEVIGHFHSKKSLEVSQQMGDSWRKFIMEHLAANRVLSIFEDEAVGLVFPEDRHCVDFATNKPFADELCTAMGIDEMAYANVYPLGTMFWARVDAIKPLFALDYDNYVQDEPLPYDGSYLHAIERLIPHVARAQGYGFKTIHRKGVLW